MYPQKIEIFEKLVHPLRAPHCPPEDHVTVVGIYIYWYMSPLLKTILTLPVPPGVGQIRIFHRDYHFCSKYPTFTR